MCSLQEFRDIRVVFRSSVRLLNNIRLLKIASSLCVEPISKLNLSMDNIFLKITTNFLFEFVELLQEKRLTCFLYIFKYKGQLPVNTMYKQLCDRIVGLNSKVLFPCKMYRLYRKVTISWMFSCTTCIQVLFYGHNTATE